MTDEELDLLVGQASPISDAQVATLDLGSGDLDLLEAIVSTTLEAPTPIVSGRRRRPVLLAAAGIAAVAASLVGVLAIGSDSKGGGTAFAAELVAVAQANERLLIRGWSVTRADEFSVDNGEMAFSDGSHEVELRWGPAADYTGLVKDRRDPGGTEQVGQVAVLGRRGLLFHYLGGDEYTALVEPDGPHYLELRGDVGSESAYRAVLDRLHAVDVDTWLDALPASVVKPVDRATVIDQMLVGVPLPSGFNRSALDASAKVNDRYQLGAQVTTAVVCGWFETYFAATEQGDAAAAGTARDVLVGSRNWPVLQSMSNRGDLPEVLWTVTDALAPGASADAATVVTRGRVATNLNCPAVAAPGSTPTPTVP